MKILLQLALLVTMVFFSSEILSRDPQPINSKFNIGRDTVTSDGYGIYVHDDQFYNTFGGTAITHTSIFGYGFNRWSGCTFAIPFLLHQRQDQQVSRGLSDLQCVLQWHPYRSDDQILVFKTGVQFPTGDVSAQPALSTGAFNPILYMVAVHSSEKLFADFVLGAIIGTTRRHRHEGTMFDYQLSIGPKFPKKNDSDWYAFLELQGFYTFPSKFHGHRVANTGGNIILFGPTFSHDSPQGQILARIQLPISQRLFGNQPKTNFFASFNFQLDI